MRKKNKTSLINRPLIGKILKKLPVLMGVVVISYVAVLIKDIEVPTILPVEDIQVEGDLHFLLKEEIMQSVQDNVTDGYFAVDLKQIREALLQWPWIKDVALRRKWPASVVVMIEEQKPLAFWNDDAYIGESGDVFRPVIIDKNLNLPHLNGPETQHVNVLKFMNTLYKQMALLDYGVKSLDLDDRRAWQMVIESNVKNIEEEKAGNTVERIEVRLGRFETEKRLQRFIRILPALSAQSSLTENRIEVIDMRYPNGFAVKMADQVTVQVSGGEEINASNFQIKELTENSKKVIKQFNKSFKNKFLKQETAQGFVYAHRAEDELATVSMSGA